MRKIAVICSVLMICLFITGCSKKAQATSPDNLYSIDADITHGSFKSKVNMTRLGNGAWDITFAQPETLKGLTMSYENGNVKMSYQGLEETVKNESKHVCGNCTFIANILDKLAYSSKELEFTENDKNIKAEGKKNGCDFAILFDKKNKELQGLDCNDLNLKVKFSEYKAVK